jgi:hypothetical protein
MARTMLKSPKSKRRIQRRFKPEEHPMNRILAIVTGLALAGAAFAAEPVKTEPAKTEAAAPAKTNVKTETAPAKKNEKNTKAQPKGRTGQMKGGQVKSTGGAQ